MATKSIDRNNLYDVTTLADLAMGELVVFTPVHEDGSLDLVRAFRFQGRTALGGMMIAFEIPAANVAEALDGWLAALNARVQELQSNAIQQHILAGARAGAPGGPPPAKIVVKPS